MKNKTFLFIVLLLAFISCEKKISGQDSKIYLDPNGITIKCKDCVVGYKGILDGIEYEVVDNAWIIRKRNGNADKVDLSRICTSFVTDMSQLFYKTEINQQIGNWDVSNVVNMRSMFSHSTFNQSIDQWDVSKVQNMDAMFYESEFNQPIDKWNVGRVENMEMMFQSSQFNQPIGSWDVNKVLNMDGMFTDSKFNQNISNWCVKNFSTEPDIFSIVCPLSEENKPIWGSCPV